MKLKKDELLIAAEAIRLSKHELCSFRNDPDLFTALERFEERLEQAGRDNRRQGRTSMNDWSDVKKRFVKGYV